VTDDRAIEMEVEVVGTPEEVWRAIATGPGISSWYVPHVVEGQAGGAMTASFGPGPEMQVAGRVAAWDPPNRVAFDGGEGVPGLAFEWLVEARDGGTCVVRLVNSGFASGAEWDAQFDAMTEGWAIFLRNLQLHLKHFAGQEATAMLPMASWAEPGAEAWARLTEALGVPAAPEVGSRIEVKASDSPDLAGTVVDVTPTRISLLVDQPLPGTAFFAAEGRDDSSEVSIWSYLYGPDAAAVVEQGQPRWFKWLAESGPGDAKVLGSEASGSG